MIERLKKLLQYLESEIDPDSRKKVFECHRRALDWEETERLPLVVTFPYPETAHFKPFPHHEIFDNPEKMLFNELVHAFDTSIVLHQEINDDLPFTVRANFGTVVIASIFGAKIEQRGDNPPWVRHFETLDEFNKIFDKDPMDFTRGYGAKIMDTYLFYQQLFSDFPNLQNCVKLVLPDLQGPLDTLELLRGSNIYTDFILDPEMVDKGLAMMSRAQIGFAKNLKSIINDVEDGFSNQHATYIKGNILIRNDSSIMISPEMYSAQVAPHDKFVLDEMHGGGIHSCGKIDFNIPEIFKLSSIRSFDFGQSYLNDLDTVYTLADKRRISLIRIRVGKEELLSGKIKERFPTGVSLICEATSYEEAKFIAQSYRTLCPV